MDNLSPQWQTTDLESLMRVASSHLQTIVSIRKHNEEYKKEATPKPKDTKDHNKNAEAQNKKGKHPSTPTPTPQERTNSK